WTPENVKQYLVPTQDEDEQPVSVASSFSPSGLAETKKRKGVAMPKGAIPKACLVPEALDKPSGQNVRPRPSGKPVDTIDRETIAASGRGYEVRMPIPRRMLLRLLHDHYRATVLNKPLDFPRPTSVETILSDYVEYISPLEDGSGDVTMTSGPAREGEKKTPKRQLTETYVAGLKSTFNTLLPLCLLYENEREDYDGYFGEHLTQSQQEPSDPLSPVEYYGAEHLLRLFTRLPEVLALQNIPESALSELICKSQEVLQYMNSREESLFE
ncbi:mortality factor-related chromodomain protein, partial [Kipferlia bialata]